MLGFERKSRLFGHLLPQEYLEINEKNILGDNLSDSLDTGRLSAFFASYKVRVWYGLFVCWSAFIAYWCPDRCKGGAYVLSCIKNQFEVSQDEWKPHKGVPAFVIKA